MKKVKLENGSVINCISTLEAEMLDLHIDGYFDNGIIINDGDTILDVGANIGMFGYKLAKKYKNLNISAFEPIPDIHRVLKENSKLSENNNYNTYQIGISDKNEDKEIVYYPNSPAMSTFNPEIWNDKEQLTAAFQGSLEHSPKSWWWSSFVPKAAYPLIIKWFRSKPKKINCKLKTLSRVIRECFIKKIDLIKIDCEGNELKVLDGIENNDWRIIKQIVLEVHNINGALKTVIDLLEKKGFEIKIITEPSLEKTNLKNIIGVRKNELC